MNWFDGMACSTKELPPKSVQEELSTSQCPVCLEVPKWPTNMSSTCKHMGCLECVEGLRGNSWEFQSAGFVGISGELLSMDAKFTGKCPICRECMAVSPTPSVVQVDAEVRKRRLVVCSFCSKLAGTSVFDYVKHLTVCSSKLPSCPHCERKLPALHTDRQGTWDAKAYLLDVLRFHITSNQCDKMRCMDCNRTGRYSQITACGRRHLHIQSLNASLLHLRADMGQFPPDEQDDYDAELKRAERAVEDMEVLCRHVMDDDDSEEDGEEPNADENGIHGMEDDNSRPNNDDGVNENEEDSDDEDADMDSDSDSDGDSHALVVLQRSLVRRLGAIVQSFAAHMERISATGQQRTPQLLAGPPPTPLLTPLHPRRNQLIIDIIVAYFMGQQHRE